MLHTVLLTLHVAAGSTGLVLGPLAFAVSKRAGWHPRLGRAYQGAVAAMTATALGLVALAPGRLWGLGLVAAATEVAALVGWEVRRRHAAGWLAGQAHPVDGRVVHLVRHRRAGGELGQPAGLGAAHGDRHPPDLSRREAGRPSQPAAGPRDPPRGAGMTALVGDRRGRGAPPWATAVTVAPCTGGRLTLQNVPPAEAKRLRTVLLAHRSGEG
jgi:hypothetical protein